MKRFLFILVAFWCFCSFYACNESSDFIEIEKPTPATGYRNFPNVPVKVDTALNLQILFQTENGCGRFSRVDTTTVGKEFTLKYYAKYPVEGSDVVCADVAKPLVYNKPFRPRQSGTYRFRFWINEDEYQEKIIEVQ